MKHLYVRKLANPAYAHKRAQRRNDRDDRLDILAVVFGGGMEVGR